jgi:tRNA(adenine34) deaminase
MGGEQLTTQSEASQRHRAAEKFTELQKTSRAFSRTLPKRPPEIDLPGEDDLKEDIVHMPVGLFAQDPETIAASLASKEVSPQGPATGMRVLAFYITRSRRGLSPSQRRKLEKARKLLSVQVDKAIKEQERRKIA